MLSFHTKVDRYHSRCKTVIREQTQKRYQRNWLPILLALQWLMCEEEEEEEATSARKQHQSGSLKIISGNL